MSTPSMPVSCSVGVLLLALTAGAVGCSRPAQATSEAAPQATFPVASPRVADAAYERQYVAEVRAKQRVEIRPRIAGFIEAVAVDEGQAVKAGQLLFSVNATQLKQQVLVARAVARRAEADLKAAELEQASTKMLFDKQVVSQAELALAEAKVQALNAELEEARANERRAEINLGYAQIRAPFDGVINRIPLRVGSAVDPSQVLTTITDIGEVYAYFRVSEAEHLAYTAAGGERPREVWLELADGSTHPTPGVIDAVESEVDRSTGNIAFRARFDNQAGRLKHGSSGRVILRQDLRSALLVPQKSTFEVQEQLYVYVVGPDNRARAKRIVPKLRIDDSFVIDSGLASTDRFVLEGVQKLKDGFPVKPLEAGEMQGKI